MKEEDGQRFMLPAEEYSLLRNSENPELYAIFPYRLFGVGKPDLDVAGGSFEKRQVKRTGGWTQDPIQAAYLGLTDVARRYTAQNFSIHHQGSRFPAFWGPNFDWAPDQGSRRRCHEGASDDAPPDRRREEHAVAPRGQRNGMLTSSCTRRSIPWLKGYTEKESWSA